MGRKIQTIGRYAMDGATLGKGNFARVELATHELTKCKVAIKVMDTRKIKNDYIKNNLHREARLMAHLRHPNIIRLYETLKATTLYCLVLEYAGGGDLSSYIKSQKDGRVSESAARPFIRQLISALDYMHQRGVVHRDLKMENIMLDEKKKNIKIIDFGLSNVYREEEPLRTHCGSPEYAAPELFIDSGPYGPEVDIWSLGIILYAMIIGRLPFRTPFRDEYQHQQMLNAIQKGLSTNHDREMHCLTTDCRNLLRQLIEPNPELRLPLPEIQHHPWITRNGKQPFFPFQPPPKDKNMKHQIIIELAALVDKGKKEIAETVNENRADEMSAMFNMMIDMKKKEMGLFDNDHTTRRGAKRDRERESRSRSRERQLPGKSPGKARGKGCQTKGGGKAGTPAKGPMQTKTKGERSSTPVLDREKDVTGATAAKKPRPKSPSRIPVRSPRKETADSPTKSAADGESSKRPHRPSTLQYRTNPRVGFALNNEASGGPSANKAMGAIPKQYMDLDLGHMTAPKATPEDITTYSTSSSDTNLETMQTEMLNASDDEKLLRQYKLGQLGAQVNPATSSQKEDVASLDKDISELKLKDRPRDFLLKQLSDSRECFEDSGSQVSRSSHSGSHMLPRDSGSGSGLLAGLGKKNSEVFDSNTCLLPQGGSGPLLVGDLSEGQDTVSSLVSHGNPERDMQLRRDCRVCGLSPSSPTYLERHQKFCHTGAHALDLFVSPDEVPSPTGPLWRPVVASTSHASPTQQPCLGYHFPKVGAATPRVTMQMPVATVESYNTDDEDDEEEEEGHSKPLIPGGRRGSPTHKARMDSRANPVKRTSGHKAKHEKRTKGAREKYKKHSKNGVFTHVPDNTMRLEPTGPMSSDSLSDGSSVGKPEGSLEKLSSGSKARVHPMDIGKDEDSSGSSRKSRIPRPTSRLGKIQMFGLLQSTDKVDKGSSGTDEGVGQPDDRVDSDEHPPPSPLQKKGHKKLAKQSDHKNKQLSWRQGLSHLLRRTRSSSLSSTNNNISASQRGKQSNGTTANSVSKHPAKAPVTTGNHREEYYKEMDARWTAPPPNSSPAHKCNSMIVTSSPVPSTSPSPVAQLYELDRSRSGTPTSPQHLRHSTPHTHSHHGHHRKVTWTGCKECARSDQSSDESQEMTCQTERQTSGAIKSSMVATANDTKQLTRTTKV